MRKPTGKGKTQDNLLDPPATKTGIAGLLFNFDFDDATVKPEHQDWLRRFAVPQLTASRNSTIALKGMASRQGSDAYNNQLSQRRVDAVKEFLLKEGVLASQIRATFIGEAGAMLAGRADGTDDEIDRAVSVDILPPERGQVAFFSSRNGGGQKGFQFNSPQWLMVPALFQTRALRLRNAEGMLVRTSAPAVVRMKSETGTQGMLVNDFIVPEKDHVIEFVGSQPGSAKIEVFELNGELKRTLAIDCLPRRDVAVAFHFVSDAKNKTDRTKFSAQSHLREANGVFNDQANVFFHEIEAAPLAFDGQDLGNPISEATVGGKFQKISRRGNPQARINVFYVWKWQSVGEPLDVDARVDEIPGSNVVYEDSAGIAEGITMAHEFGHCLGLRHEDKDDPFATAFIMFPFTDQQGSTIHPEDAVTANKFAVSVKG